MANVLESYIRKRRCFLDGRRRTTDGCIPSSPRPATHGGTASVCKLHFPPWYSKMDAKKKAKLEMDVMDVDTTGDTATLVSLKTSTTTGRLGYIPLSLMDKPEYGALVERNLNRGHSQTTFVLYILTRVESKCPYQYLYRIFASISDPFIPGNTVNTVNTVNSTKIG